MKKVLSRLSLIALTILFSACATKHSKCGSGLSIIPQPLEINVDDPCDGVRISSFEFDHSDSIMVVLAEEMATFLKLPPDGNGKTIRLKIDTTLNNREAYRIISETDGVDVIGGGHAGVGYGIVTVSQMMNNGRVPLGEINDAPKFEWRGFMLDVSRHFQPKEKVKKLLDMLAYHKINKFHWHLTDGIGWRIEIEGYPELTTRGAWRVEKRPEAPWVGLELTTQDDPNAYGGYYTKDDVREIVAYAKKLNIEVIPEIEMPGHSEAATFVYPQYSCVNAKPGSGVYCPGKETTFFYLFRVLDQVMELFPSKYIHIGGDEVGKGQWSVCPDCQKKKKEKELKDEHELQSYFIGRVNEFVESRGKKLIGWDEILEGGLAKGATVMSWTGWEGGIKAAEKGSYVIMCPLDYVYLDHYQGYSNNEPQGWGGYNGLKRVYDFPVIPEHMPKETQKMVLGGQANLWTENIATWEHLQYMLLPRLSALSEALWCGSENKNWNAFTAKLNTQLARFDQLGWLYSESAFTPTVEKTVVDENGVVSVKLQCEMPNTTIHYTLEGLEVLSKGSEVYDSVVVVEKNATLIASVVDSTGKKRGYTLVLPNLANKATMKKVEYLTPYNKQYNGGGESALVDNVFGVKRGDDKSWQGFEKDNAVVVIDLEQVQVVNKADLRFLQHIGSTSVMLPEWVMVELSMDGKTFEQVAKEPVEQTDHFDALVREVVVNFTPQDAKYIKITAKNRGVLPNNISHPRAGDNAWVFLDEIMIN